MGKAWPWPRNLAVQGTDSPQRPIPGEGAESNDRPAVREQLQLTLQVGQAVVALLRCWLVGWGRTAHDGRHVGVRQLKAIATAFRRRLAGVAGAVQRCI